MAQTKKLARWPLATRLLYTYLRWQAKEGREYATRVELMELLGTDSKRYLMHELQRMAAGSGADLFEPGDPPHDAIGIRVEGACVYFTVGEAKAHHELVDVADRLIKLWLETTPGRSRCRVTKKRVAKVVARLREGFTEDGIATAIKRFAKSEWHAGKNPQGTLYNDITFLCRDAETLERWELAPEPEDDVRARRTFKDALHG